MYNTQTDISLNIIQPLFCCSTVTLRKEKKHSYKELTSHYLINLLPSQLYDMQSIPTIII